MAEDAGGITRHIARHAELTNEQQQQAIANNGREVAALRAKLEASEKDRERLQTAVTKAHERISEVEGKLGALAVKVAGASGTLAIVVSYFMPSGGGA